MKQHFNPASTHFKTSCGIETRFKLTKQNPVETVLNWEKVTCKRCLAVKARAEKAAAKKVAKLAKRFLK